MCISLLKCTRFIFPNVWVDLPCNPKTCFCSDRHLNKGRLGSLGSCALWPEWVSPLANCPGDSCVTFFSPGPPLPLLSELLMETLELWLLLSNDNWSLIFYSSPLRISQVFLNVHISSKSIAGLSPTNWGGEGEFANALWNELCFKPVRQKPDLTLALLSVF